MAHKIKTAHLDKKEHSEKKQHHITAHDKEMDKKNLAKARKHHK